MATRGVSQEVKEEILSKVKAGEPVAALAKQYGISDKAIYNWIGEGLQRRFLGWIMPSLGKKTNS